MLLQCMKRAEELGGGERTGRREQRGEERRVNLKFKAETMLWDPYIKLHIIIGIRVFDVQVLVYVH